jgi:membrane protease YdiL (CAAX protease family)
MLGILIELIVSWLLIWIFEKKHLSVLGVAPSTERLQNLVFGIVVSAGVCAIYYLVIGYFASGDWTVNERFSMQSFFSGAWWTFKSVLFEELIFRGALLYIAISRLGIKLACIISAVAFGIYHWFSYNVFGDPAQMAITFVVTGIAGLMFAFAFAASKSLYLPIGLHYGYNFISIIIFSNGPLGEQALILKNGGQVGNLLSLALFLYQVLALPLVVLWYVKTRRESILN